MSIYLIRHGSAGTSNPTDPNDSERTLDEKGLAQADLLRGWLAGEPIGWIVSSPYPRCTQTVAPLAGALGLVLRTDDRLAESSHVDAAWDLVGSLADEAAANRGAATDGNSTRDQQKDVVICSHGDVIPDLIRRAQLRGMRVHGRSGCSKGSVWKLDGWDGERFGSGSYSVVKP